MHARSLVPATWRSRQTNEGLHRGVKGCCGFWRALAPSLLAPRHKLSAATTVFYPTIRRVLRLKFYKAMERLDYVADSKMKTRRARTSDHRYPARVTCSKSHAILAAPTRLFKEDNLGRARALLRKHFPSAGEEESW